MLVGCGRLFLLLGRGSGSAEPCCFSLHRRVNHLGTARTHHGQLRVGHLATRHDVPLRLRDFRPVEVAVARIDWLDGIGLQMGKLCLH